MTKKDLNERISHLDEKIGSKSEMINKLEEQINLLCGFLKVKIETEDYIQVNSKYYSPSYHSFCLDGKEVNVKELNGMFNNKNVAQRQVIKKITK